MCARKATKSNGIDTSIHTDMKKAYEQMFMGFFLFAAVPLSFGKQFFNQCII